MIIKSRFAAQAFVGIDLAATDIRVLHAVADKMAELIIDEVENVGCQTSKLSIWVSMFEDKERPWEVGLVAQWCPDPTTGVELVGGPLDGDLKEISREDHGLPPRRVTWPVLIPFSYLPPDTPDDTPLAYTNPTYELQGINSATDRWVYTFKG